MKLLEDRVGSGSPPEWLGIGVVMRDELIDSLDELLDAGERTAAVFWPCRRMLSGMKMYVCRRCQSNFKTGEGMPDAKISGLGKCDACLTTSPSPPRVNGAAS